MGEMEHAFLRGGGEMGERTRNYDWAKTSIGTPDTWPQSLRTTLSILLNSKFPMFLFWGPECLCFYNDAYRPSLGLSGQRPDVLGRPGAEVWPDIWEVIAPQINNILQSGEATFREDALLPIFRNGRLEDAYWTSSYSPVIDNDGAVEGVFVTCMETTKTVQAFQQLQASEARFRSLIEKAPVAMSVSSGRDYVVEIANDLMFEIWGKRPEDILGKPVFEAMPEARGQGFEEILEGIFNTGERFTANEILIHLVRNGKPEPVYLNLVYQPVREGDGSISGIMQVAIDVTQHVLATQKIAEAEAGLRDALELGELATWNVDVATGKTTYSERLQGWLGIDKALYDATQPSLRVHPADRERISAAVRKALEKGSDGRYDETYTITHAVTGAPRIIHASGQAYYDADGNAVRLSGTAQDVTIQKDLQAALEQEVQLRTEELAAANEALQVTVEELAESNAQLSHSNDELAQYAYVASHDLQEPLRKIRVFTGLLKASQKSVADNAPIIEKIISSAERMSMLIQDLLSFSRLLKSDTLMRPVALRDTVGAVWNDFELTVEEKGATLEVSELPVIEAINLQINQLFHNLINNALKFTEKDKKPHICISAALATPEEVAQFISKPLLFSRYYHITVRDNGIGFDTQYSEQIFEVFKRLHGRDLYPGSGIGLALCRRIAANHHGHLYAESRMGEGSVFHIFLPEKQHDTASEFSRERAVFLTAD